MPKELIPTTKGATTIGSYSERWPWPVRHLLAILAASVAVIITYALPFLHPFPLLLPFPVALIACWSLGMWPGILCALLETILAIPLLRQMTVTPAGPLREELRMALFLLVTMAFGWILRRLDQMREQLDVRDLQQQLAAANAQRELAEEQARAAQILREREDLLQIALRAHGMGVWIWDLAAGDVQWSDEVYRIIGVTPGAFAPNTSGYIDFIHPDDAPRVYAAVEHTRTTGAAYQQLYRVRHPDGSERWVESQGCCQRDAEGRPQRIVGVIADVTSRKLSDEAMLRAEKLAVAGRLAASIAHEINNPLEAVANLLYLIAHSNKADDAASLAHQALDELMRVSLITQQTLKFHRQTGTPRPTHPAEVLQTVLDLFRGRFLVSRIATELDVDDEAVISCMPGEVQQIFANLVSNAIDSMPQGGRLAVRMRTASDWRDYKTPGVRTTFFDTGSGMSAATRARIFEPFFTTKTDTGTGLGMWVVAQLVERHRGSVNIWSTQRENSGATAISVFLPLNIPRAGNETIESGRSNATVPESNTTPDAVR